MKHAVRAAFLVFYGFWFAIALQTLDEPYGVHPSLESARTAALLVVIVLFFVMLRQSRKPNKPQ